MFKFLRFGPLFIGTILLVSASLGCSFWFFYSFLDTGSSNQMMLNIEWFQVPLLPVVAGAVGCGAQLFVYSFTANLTHVKDLLFKAVLILISVMTIGLSMFSTYSTLISFLENKSNAMSHHEFVSEQRQKIIESRASDMSINSTSAEQAISDKYRTQSKGLTDVNESLREKQLNELSNLSTTAVNKASPLDGLVRVVGSDSMVSTLFCAWLAITFDLLPILGISLLGRLAMGFQREKLAANLVSHGRTEINENTDELPNIDTVATSNERKELVGSTANLLATKNIQKNVNVQVPDDKTVEELNKLGKENDENALHQNLTRGRTHKKDVLPTSMDKNTQPDPHNRILQEIIDKKSIFSDIPADYQKVPIGEIPTEILYPIITKYLSEGAIPISYSGVIEFTGLSKWKVQQYFTKAVEEGFLVNKTKENIEAGYGFSKKVRYHIKRDADLEGVVSECQRW